MNRKREPIWEISSRWRSAYFYLFSIQGLIGECLVIWYELALRTDDTAIETCIAIYRDLALVAAGAAANTFVILEVMNNAMITGKITEQWLRQRLLEPLKEKQRAEGLAEGLEEGKARGIAEGKARGRAEADASWKAWNRRRLEAERKGLAFNEPIPDFSENGTNAKNGS